jgi:hypothetical protein
MELTVVHLAAPSPAPIALGRIRRANRTAPDRTTASPSPVLQDDPRPPPAAEPAGPDANADRLRNVLRGLVGCAQPAAYGLTRSERDACDHRAVPPAPVQVQIDAKAQAAFDADAQSVPLLVRKPKNGCLPRLADRPSAVASRGARSGATTSGGVGCAWSF